MGVHMLLYWTAAEGAGRREAHDALAAAILCLGGTATAGRWATQVSLLRAAPPRSGADDPPAARAGGASGMVLHRVTLSDEPDQMFLLSRSAGQVLQAGAADMQALLDKAVQLKARGSVQLEGQAHAAGDFRICLARAVQAPQQDFLGLVVDACYQPLDDAAQAAPLLQDLAEVLQEAAEAAGGRLRRVEPGGAGFQLVAAFGARHRAALYAQLMAALQE